MKAQMFDKQFHIISRNGGTFWYIGGTIPCCTMYANSTYVVNGPIMRGSERDLATPLRMEQREDSSVTLKI